MGKKSISVPEMRAILGIGKTESYWLLKKKYFETVIVFGKITVSHHSLPYFFVYCDPETVCEIIRNWLDTPLNQSYNPNAPGDRGKTPQIHGSVFIRPHV